MSIYRRYVSAIGLENAIRGEGAFTSLLAEPDHVVCYITVPDEDAPEPPEIDFEREYRDAVGTSCRIVGPPVWSAEVGGHWRIMGRWPSGNVGSYPLRDLTPIEPAPERTYTAEQVRAARRAEVLEVMKGWTTKEEAEEVAAEHANDLLARLEGSDD